MWLDNEMALMQFPKIIEKREFIQHTSKYIKWVEEDGNTLVITHQNRPDLVLAKIKLKSLKVLNDMNEHVLPRDDEW